MTILLDGLGGTTAGCRRLPRQFMCGLAVPLAPPTGPSAGADRVAHFHAAGWASGPWMLYVTYDPQMPTERRRLHRALTMTSSAARDASTSVDGSGTGVTWN